MKTIHDIPRKLNKKNIDAAIETYKELLTDIPLKIEESNLLNLLTRLKRGKIGSGPWNNVSIFEAANRQAVKKTSFLPNHQLSQSNNFDLSQAKFCCVWVSVKNI